MYVYDRANELAKDIRESEEYRAYKELKDKVDANTTTKGLVAEYKRLQFQAQAIMMSGQQPGSDIMEKLQKVGEVLAYDKDASDYFAAEYKMNMMISDIYRIIGEACGIDLDMLKK